MKLAGSLPMGEVAILKLFRDYDHIWFRHTASDNNYKASVLLGYDGSRKQRKDIPQTD